MAKKIEKYLPVDYSDSFSIEVTEIVCLLKILF